MALIPCPQCGHSISDKALRCPQCGHPNTPVKPQKQSKKWIIPVVIISTLLLLGGGVGGWFYYKNIYKPRKIDAEAPRYYTFAHILHLRSSMSSGADFNKIAELPYGTELITYDHGEEWSKVKVSTPNYNGVQPEGYVSSDFILNKHDFFILNSIFGDTDSKDVIHSAKCRIALLNFFKEKKYIGKLSEQERLEAKIDVIPNANNQWQVFSKAKKAKYNTVYYKRVVNPDSKFTDFAVIIRNVTDPSIKRLLLFTFDDDETPHLRYEENVPKGADKYIKKIEVNYWDNTMFDVYYTGN